MDWASDAIEYLDRHDGAFTALLTLALVGVTIYYAVQNRRMVGEMAKTRALSVLPKLALEFHRLGPTVVTIAIRNVGPGAALDVSVMTVWEPRAGGDPVETKWSRNILGSGEKFDFMPPGDLNGNLNSLPDTYATVRLVGTMRDATGTVHRVEEGFYDLPAWRQTLGDAHQRFVFEDAEKRLAEELHKKLDPSLKGLATQIGHVAAAITDAAPKRQGQ